MADAEKLVIMVTHGPEEAEFATIPFVMAGAAVASDVAVCLGSRLRECDSCSRGSPRRWRRRSSFLSET